eukprot:25729-Amphidinium_carterae.1
MAMYSGLNCHSELMYPQTLETKPAPRSERDLAAYNIKIGLGNRRAILGSKCNIVQQWLSVLCRYFGTCPRSSVVLLGGPFGNIVDSYCADVTSV